MNILFINQHSIYKHCCIKEFLLMGCSVTFAADMVPALCGIKKGILLKSGAIPVAVKPPSPKGVEAIT